MHILLLPLGLLALGASDVTGDSASAPSRRPVPARETVPAAAPGLPAAPAVAPATDEPAAPAVPAAAFGQGSFPGSFLVPGTDVSLKIGGRIKADAIVDLDPIGTADEFKTSSIPVPRTSSSGNTSLHARDTRLHMELRTPSGIGELRGYVEGNFFGDGDSFTLRHAYLESPQVLAGHTWTNFMMIDSRPENLDFEGPDGSVFLRQGQVRWKQPVTESVLWTLALEDPGSDLTGPAGATGEQELPDLSTGLRFDDGPDHVYVSAILRRLSYEGAGSDSATGWGGSVSGRLGTWGRDDFRFQAAFGHGIARYIEDLRGFGLDAALDASGNLEALPTYGGFLAYRHFWSDALRSTLVHSMTDVDNSAGQAMDAIQATSYSAANLIWTAAEGFDVGVEVLYGTRENKDGQDADATRIMFSLIYTP